LPLRFSLRTLLAVITILCVVFGWRINRARLQREAAQMVRAAHGFVVYDYELRSDLEPLDDRAKPWEPAWLQSLVGIDFFHDVTGVRMCLPASDVDIAPSLKRLPRLRSLWLRGVHFDDATLRTVGRLKRLEYFVVATTTITDDGVAELSDLPRLRHVDIRLAQLGDRSLQSLARLPSLEHLEINGTRLTDGGLAALAGNQRLKHLWINASHQDELNSIGDAGALHLAKMPQLEVIGLQSTRVTPAGLAPLQKLPHLRYLALQQSAADNYAAVAPLFPFCEIRCTSGP
jgi:hypothetical protein